MQYSGRMNGTWKRFMAYNRDIPELVERYLKESGGAPCWVTVNELRTYFDLDEYAAPAISGFLHRIYSGTFRSFPYRVERIEMISLPAEPHSRNVKRYLVIRRPSGRITDRPDICDRSTTAHTQEVFTDHDAINHFDRVLAEGLRRRS